MELVSWDQNTKEFVLNSQFFGIFKVFVIKNALWLHVEKKHQTYCKRESCHIQSDRSRIQNDK